MDTNENKLAGVKIQFPQGFTSYKKASVMKNELKKKIKEFAAEEHDVKIKPSGEITGTDENVKAFNKTVTDQFALRTINFKFTGFDVVPPEKIFESFVKQLVIDAQKIRETMTDEKVVQIHGSGNAHEINLEKLFEKKTRGKTPEEKIEADFTKLSIDEQKAVIERLTKAIK